MALNFLEVLQKKPTVETHKKITQLLNDGAENPDAVIEYKRSGIILHIYSDVS